MLSVTLPTSDDDFSYIRRMIEKRLTRCAGGIEELQIAGHENLEM